MKAFGAVAGLLATVLLTGCEREEILAGERFDVRAPLADSVPTDQRPNPVDSTGDVPATARPISLPGQTVNADWTHRGGGVTHAITHLALSGAPQRIWSAPIGEGNSRRYRIAASPVVAGGRIFTMDARSGVVATSTGGGTLWRTDVTPATDRGGEAAGGGLGYADGRLFVTTGFGDLLALDAASGAVIWRQRLESALTGAPTVQGDTVYVVARDSSGWAVEAATGRLRWERPGTPAAVGMLAAAGPALAGNLVIFPMGSGEVVAVTRGGGADIWAGGVVGERRGRAYGAVGGITGDPVVVGGTTYVGNPSGRTSAFASDTGDLIWTATEGALGPVWPAGGSVFLVNDEARLVRLDAGTGAVIWSVPMPYYTTPKIRKRDQITAHYGPVLAGGRLVVASSDGLVRFFGPTDGALVGSVEVPGGATAAPAVAGGVLYVVGAGGALHAFR